MMGIVVLKISQILFAILFTSTFLACADKLEVLVVGDDSQC